MFNYRTCCRLCLKDSKVIVNCAEIIDLRTKIEEIFGFKITKDDYSTKICRDCTYQVTNFAVFREAVLNNQKTIENYKNLERKIEAFKKEESDDDVVFITEEKEAEVTSSTNCSENETPSQNSICLPATSSSKNKNKVRLKKLKVILQQLNEKDVMGLKMKRKDQKALNFRTQRKSFENAIKILNIILSDEKNRSESQTNQNKTPKNIENSCMSTENLKNIENVVDNMPLNTVENEKQTSVTESKSEEAINNQPLKNIQELVNSKESRILDNNEKIINNSNGSHTTDSPSPAKTLRSIRIKTVNARNPQLHSLTQSVLSNESSTVHPFKSQIPSNIELSKSSSDSTIASPTSNNVSISSSTLNHTNNSSLVSLIESHQTLSNNLSTMPVTNHSRLSTGSTASMIQPQKPQTIILKPSNSTKRAIPQSSYPKHLPASSSYTSTVQTKTPIKICKISTLLTAPSTSSVSNALSSSQNSIIQQTLKNGVNTNNLILIKPNNPNLISSNSLSTSNSVNVQTFHRQSNQIHVDPPLIQNQLGVGTEHGSNITLPSSASSSLPKATNNPISDHRVKVLSVNELNLRAAMSSSSRDQQQWTVEGSNLSLQKLPIRITLSRLRDKIRIKLTDHLMSDIHFNNLSLQERVAVRKSLLQPSSRLKIMKAIQECSLDVYSENLLNSIGLRSVFNCSTLT